MIYTYIICNREVGCYVTVLYIMRLRTVRTLWRRLDSPKT